MPEPVSLPELKAFARIDDDSDDSLVTSLGIAAREFIEQATGRRYQDALVPERAKVAIKSLATFWFENRGDTNVEPPAHVRRLVSQLRDWSEPADDEEVA